MINGLIANAKQISRDITIAVIILGALVWTVNQLVNAAGKLKDVFNPSAFHEEIIRAEHRSKELIANQIANERALSATEHREVMSAVIEGNKRSERIERKLDNVIDKFPSMNARLFDRDKSVN